ncbi:MAG: hypothetical protein HQL08_14105, partial [Nitrospirae bacterium]|nr:hypothetical protein [Nitrospirota bacterium]
TDATTRNAWFIPDVAGAYVVKDSSNTSSLNTITIYAGKWAGVITSAGETSQKVSASGVTQVTDSKGNVLSNLESGMWFDTTNTAYWPNGATGSYTYTNWPTITVDSGCTACHYNSVVANGLTAPDKFTPWTYTAHATFMARGMNAITGNSGACLTCHSVGFDQAPGASSGTGFDDIALLDGWSYPSKDTTKPYSNWKTMAGTSSYSNLIKLANIQCENCHGPQGSDGHISGLAGSTKVAGGTRVNYSAELCGICHDSGTGHHLYSEWAASLNPFTAGSTVTINVTSTSPKIVWNPTAGVSGHGHANYGQATYTNYAGASGAQSASTTQAGTVTTSSISAPSCSRCHTAEGFAAYATQLSQYTGQSQIPSTAGALQSTYVPNSITGGSATTYGTTVWTADNAHSQTCTACHDPHSDKNPNQLRIYDTIPMTMAGFGVSGLGKGAICVACHNERNGVACDSAHAPGTTPLPGICNSISTNPSVQSGATFLHEDGDTVAPLYLDTPHDNTQAEVLMGRDVFFMSGSLPMLSKHANVEDACVGCHMTLNPQTHLSHGAAATSTHVWYINDADRPTLCANCHSSSVDGQAIVASTQNQVAVLMDALGTNMLSYLKANYGSASIYIGGSNNSTLTAKTGMTAVPVSSIGAIYLGNNPTNCTAANVSAGNCSITNGDAGQSTFYFYDASGNALKTSSGSALSAGLTAISTDSSGLSLIFGANSIYKKAIWNLMIVQRDYSWGVHNPSFVSTVLATTITQVKTVGSSRVTPAP